MSIRSVIDGKPLSSTGFTVNRSESDTRGMVETHDVSELLLGLGRIHVV